jgi:hypothetical protein
MTKLIANIGIPKEDDKDIIKRKKERKKENPAAIIVLILNHAAQCWLIADVLAICI